jgi:hypothetical protein
VVGLGKAPLGGPGSGLPEQGREVWQTPHQFSISELGNCPPYRTVSGVAGGGDIDAWGPMPSGLGGSERASLGARSFSHFSVALGPLAPWSVGLTDRLFLGPAEG